MLIFNAYSCLFGHCGEERENERKIVMLCRKKSWTCSQAISVQYNIGWPTGLLPLLFQLGWNHWMMWSNRIVVVQAFGPVRNMKRFRSYLCRCWILYFEHDIGSERGRNCRCSSNRTLLVDRIVWLHSISFDLVAILSQYGELRKPLLLFDPEECICSESSFWHTKMSMSTKNALRHMFQLIQIQLHNRMK